MIPLRSALAGAIGSLTVACSIALAWGNGPRAGAKAPSPSKIEPALVEGPPAGPLPVQAPSTRAALSEELLGVILARLSADIAPRFEGRLEDVRVRLGDRVAAGDVLAVLDAPALRFDLRSAEASLNTAGVDKARTLVELAEARERLERRRSLADEHLTTQEDLATARYQEELAKSRIAATKAQIDERRSQVERLRQDNRDLSITAPFDGIVAIRYVDPGTTVRPSTPIVRIISMRDAFVRFAAPEAVARAMAVGQPVRVVAGDARRELRGTIEKVAPEIDAAAHLVFVEAGLPPLDPDFPVLSGAIVRVSPISGAAATDPSR